MVARNSKTRKRSRRKKRMPPKDSPLQELAPEGTDFSE
jgi:hypothetical protein